MAFAVFLAVLAIATFRQVLQFQFQLQGSSESSGTVEPWRLWWAYVSIPAPLVWGWLADRYSAARVAVIALCLQSLLTSAKPFLDAGTGDAVVALALNAVDDFWLPCAVVFIGRHLSVRRRPFQFVLVLIALNTGQLMSAYLPSIGDDWRAVALAFGLAPTLAAIPLWLLGASMPVLSSTSAGRPVTAWLGAAIAAALISAAEFTGRNLPSTNYEMVGVALYVTRGALSLILVLSWFAGARDERRANRSRRLWCTMAAAITVAATLGRGGDWTAGSLFVFVASTNLFESIALAMLTIAAPAPMLGRIAGACGVLSLLAYRGAISLASGTNGAWVVAALVVLTCGVVWISRRAHVGSSTAHGNPARSPVATEPE